MKSFNFLALIAAVALACGCSGGSRAKNADELNAEFFRQLPSDIGEDYRDVFRIVLHNGAGHKLTSEAPHFRAFVNMLNDSQGKKTEAEVSVISWDYYSVFALQDEHLRQVPARTTYGRDWKPGFTLVPRVVGAATSNAATELSTDGSLAFEFVPNGVADTRKYNVSPAGNQ